ncbi:MAG: leucine-rich repeat domain-containing protein [Fibrobacteria bacterium]
MKTANPGFRRFQTALLVSALAIAPCYSQDFVQDTLAVRILLDRNGLTQTPVAQVAEIDVEASRITVLLLSGLKLTSLPTQIGSLSALKYLVLSDNLLDSLPAALWDLTTLVDLDLGGNRISALDAKVSNLQSLLHLDLRDNGLTSIPAAIFTLPQLETVILAGNALDTLPEAVAGLAFLQILDLSGNLLRTVPSTIASMDALEILDLHANAMTSLPDRIRGLPEATGVRLSANHLCDLGPDLQAWATGKDPEWREDQTCASPVRPRTVQAGRPGLRAFAEGGRIRLDWGSRAASGMEVVLHDAKGRDVLKSPVAAGATGFVLDRAGLGGGFIWAELRVGRRSLASAALVSF